MLVSLDGSVKFCGFKKVVYKDGRTFANVSVIDEVGEPVNLFCPGGVIPVLEQCSYGDDIGVVFIVNQWQNNLNLRVKEIIR